MGKHTTLERPRESGLEGHPERTPGLAKAMPRYRSSNLFRNCPCIVIEHGGEEYRLRVTRLGKLILTK